jgi:3-oxoacyl-[acyl-carrier protein] reductase
MSGRLAGRSALITGGGSGIGRAIVETFAAEGARIALLDYRREAAEEVAAAVGGETLALQGDVSSAADIDRAVSAAVAAFGSLDVLVNNAGVFDQNAPCEEVTEEAWDRLFAINVRGTAFATQRALREMLPRGSGSIVNLSSINALVGLGGGAAYAASKGAIAAFTRQVACEVGPRGVRVNALAPGAIATNLFDNTSAILGDADPDGALGREHKSKMVEGSLAGIPLGRIGTGADVAKAAAFLASDDADYLTGVVLVVDGGYIIH